MHNIILRNNISCVQAKIFSLISNYTFDLNHNKEMSVIVRYFDDEKKLFAERLMFTKILKAK